MVPSFGSKPFSPWAVGLVASSFLLSAGFARADDELILDPELGAPSVSPKVAAEGEPTPVGLDEDDYDPLANTGLSRLELLAQVAVDLHREGDLEDAYESRLRLIAETELRRSRRLRIVLGSRLDLLWAVPAQDDPYVVARDERATDEARFELDVIPTAAYADVTIADGLHARIGEQVVTLGRMDFVSPTDMLAVYDLRPQPRFDPAAAKLAQPAVRLDWDIGRAVTLQAVYVPWFSPHLTRPTRDLFVGTVLGGPSARDAPNATRDLLDPSYQPKAQETALRFFGPAPDFSHPQASARLSVRGQTFELGLTSGTALEKLPVVYLTPALAHTLADPGSLGRNAASLAFARLAGTPPKPRQEPLPLFDVSYPRYVLTGIDGSVDVAPVTVGAELAYSPARYLATATSSGRELPNADVRVPITDNVPARAAPGCKHVRDDACVSNVRDASIRAGVPVVQGALHVEWLKGDDWVVAAEGFWTQALRLPYDRSRDWLGFIPGTGAYAGGVLAASHTFRGARVRLDTTLIAAVGPSLIAVPRIEFRASDALYLDLGLMIIEGPDVGYGRGRIVGAQNTSLGGLFDGYDQAFASVRWVP